MQAYVPGYAIKSAEEQNKLFAVVYGYVEKALRGEVVDKLDETSAKHMVNEANMAIARLKVQVNQAEALTEGSGASRAS